MIFLSYMIVIKKIKDPLFSIQSSSDLKILLLFTLKFQMACLDFGL